jgi:hypothetical protein
MKYNSNLTETYNFYLVVTDDMTKNKENQGKIITSVTCRAKRLATRSVYTVTERTDHAKTEWRNYPQQFSSRQNVAVFYSLK